jgi:hypothetical protein
MNSFERMAKDMHRKNVSKSAFDAAIEDAGSLTASVKSAASTGAAVGEKIAKGTLDSEGESAAERGHKGGLIGGPRRDEVLTSEEKTKIARKGGHARWGEARSERE